MIRAPTGTTRIDPWHTDERGRHRAFTGESWVVEPDSPGASIIITVTITGTQYADGTAHRALVIAPAPDQRLILSPQEAQRLARVISAVDTIDRDEDYDATAGLP